MGSRYDQSNRLSKSFANFMFEGRIGAALRLLDLAGSNGRPLSLDTSVQQLDGSSCSTREALYKKHPSLGPLSSSHVLL